MVENRSAALGTVFPTLVYDDVGTAIDWLCNTFGFRERYRYGPPGQPQGAMLTIGAGSVMLTAAREADPSGEWWG
ncbi:MAG TPA: VOC family protein, partial [Longimicrobiaceae bacterium]|nr:VOC family protein [Longimicrobiaceae bacterium]